MNEKPNPENTTDEMKNTTSDPMNTSGESAAVPTTDATHTNQAEPTQAEPVPTGPTTEPEPVVETNVTEESSGNGMAGMVIGAIIVALLLVAAAAWYFMSTDGAQLNGVTAGDTASIDFEVDGDPDDPVAEVNGVVLTRADLNRIRQQVVQNAQQQGADLNDPQVLSQINSQAMETLVNTELVRQGAEQSGAVADPDAVAQRYAEVEAQLGGADELAATLEEFGITDESLRSDLEQEVLIQAYIASVTDGDMTISDQEIENFYNEVGGAEAGLPPLADIRAEIEQQLLMNREQEIIDGLLEELRADATIEILI